METVYIETTIVSYLVARPSRDLVLSAHQQTTREWWESERQRYRCVTSEEVLREASRGEAEMVLARLNKLAGMALIPMDDAIERLATSFLATKALPASMRSDAVHLATATHGRTDYLLTWNCTHLANAAILRHLESEARRQGWDLPKVCTPLELIES
jgi:predicted nucleic acid-binding protein